MSSQTPSTGFSSAVEQFALYGAEQIRGSVRYEVIHRNLEPYLIDPSQHIVDVQGGNGRDAAWLIELGHRVTLLEADPGQRSKAEAVRAGLSAEAQDRFTILGGDLEDDVLSLGYFDAALCHGVTMYKDRPSDYIAQVARLVHEGGLISWVESGFEGTVSRYQSRGNISNVEDLYATGWYTNELQLRAQAFKPEAMARMLRQANCNILDWSGVRLDSDDITLSTSELPAEELEKLYDVEHAKGHDPALKRRGQMLQFIGRIRPPIHT